jgi:outer membrane protein
MRLLASALLLAAGPAPRLAAASGEPLTVSLSNGPSRAADPITLDEALQLAARQNADLLGARAELDTARADRQAAVSGVLPRLDLSADAGRTFIGRSSQRRAIVLPDGTVVETGDASDVASYSVAAQLSQPIFDWARFRDLSRAGSAQRGQERTYDERTLSIAFDVTSRFYDLVKAERSLTVLEKTVARSEELVKRAEALYEAGKAPRSDALSARANLQGDRINVEAQRARVAQARAALAQVLGRTDPDALAVVAPPGIDAVELPSGEPPEVATLLARARERRPGLLADRAFVEAAETGVSSARAGYYPSLQAVAGYSRAGSQLGGAGGVWSDPSRDYTGTARVVLSWNLFEGGFTRSQVSRARATLLGTEATRARNDQLVAREIAAARSAVVALGLEVRLATDGLAIARDALALATQRFEAGLASQIEIRDANLKVTQAELTLVQTRIDHAVATADLARAVGGAL